MQTFLPYKSFKRSAKCLDTKRHGKQRSEAKGILWLCYKSKGKDYRKQFEISDKYANLLLKRYKNHPAVLMWVGFENALKEYYNIIIQEWINKDYKNNMKLFKIRSNIIYPNWLGLKKFHSLHRANLLRKNPDFYGEYGWKEEPAKGYYWPIQKGG